MEDLVRSTSLGRAAIPNRYRPAATPRSQKRDPGPPTYCSSSPFGGDGSSGPLPRKNLRAAGRTADPSTSLRYGRDDKGGAVCFGNFVWRMRQMVNHRHLCWDGPTSAPEASVEGAVLYGLRNVAYGDGELCVEISDGASDFQYPVVCSRTQTLLLHSPLQQPFGFR